MPHCRQEQSLLSVGVLEAKNNISREEMTTPTVSFYPSQSGRQEEDEDTRKYAICRLHCSPTSCPKPHSPHSQRPVQRSGCMASMHTHSTHCIPTNMLITKLCNCTPTFPGWLHIHQPQSHNSTHGHGVLPHWGENLYQLQKQSIYLSRYCSTLTYHTQCAFMHSTNIHVCTDAQREVQ